MEYFGIWNILEYGISQNMAYFGIWQFFNMEDGIFLNETSFYNLQNISSIFRNMEYFGIWNILQYGIFWNMEYFSLWNMSYFKTKQYFMIHKTYLPYFGIWNILEYRIF